MASSIPISTTVSHHQLRHLQLDPQQALQQAIEMGFAHLRLATYWSEVEPQPGEFDFSFIKSWLQTCQESHQPVVLTLGVKAPRWPEFYWPEYVSRQDLELPENKARVLTLIEEALKQLGEFSCITHWQVENEPLNPSGPDKQTISHEFLSQEVQLVRKLDHRPVLTTLWGNDVTSSTLLDKLTDISDVVGLDLYYRQYTRDLLGLPIYVKPKGSASQLAQIIAAADKPIWITELQAEPWEKDDTRYRSAQPFSCSPERIQRNLAHAHQLGATEIFLWGFEYWLYKAAHNNSRYLNEVKQALTATQ